MLLLLPAVDAASAAAADLRLQVQGTTPAAALISEFALPAGLAFKACVGHTINVYSHYFQAPMLVPARPWQQRAWPFGATRPPTRALLINPPILCTVTDQRTTCPLVCRSIT